VGVAERRWDGDGWSGLKRSVANERREEGSSATHDEIERPDGTAAAVSVPF
jgi:hypothetical protein